jgi:acetyl esterase/lipase
MAAAFTGSDDLQRAEFVNADLRGADRIGVMGESAGGHIAAAGVPVRLVPVQGADHIFVGHDDVEGVIRLSVEYLVEHLGAVSR